MSCATDQTWDLPNRFTSSQGEVAYTRFGSGRDVVLVHGTPTSSFIWRHVAPALAGHCRVLCYDLPGYGRSAKHWDQDVRLRTQAAVCRELLEHLQIEAPILVGHDFGAAVVMGAHLVEQVPVAKICVMDGVLLSPWGTPFSRHVKEHVSVFQALPEYVHEASVRAHLKTAVQHAYEPGALDALVAPWLGEEGQAAYYRQVAQYDYDFTDLLEQRYPNLSVPVRIVWGGQDRWVSSDTPGRLRALIPQAELHILQDAGHFLMEDLPNQISENLLTFLD